MGLQVLASVLEIFSMRASLQWGKSGLMAVCMYQWFSDLYEFAWTGNEAASKQHFTLRKIYVLL